MGVKRRVALAAAVSTALLVPLALFGGSSFAKGFAAIAEYQYGGSGGSQYQYTGKVTLCHHTHSKKHPTHTIKVDGSAVWAHFRHGDTLGACTSGAHAQTATRGKHAGTTGDDSAEHSSASTGEHGNGSGHGNSGAHGNSAGHGHH